MKTEGIVKQDHIIETAIKRFSHFGIAKTTLTEIADDLGISKPSLFYYFNDKGCLVAAVAAKIFNEVLETLEKGLQQATSVEEGLKFLVNAKRDHIKKYFLLALQTDSVDLNKVSAEVVRLHQDTKEKLERLVAELLQKGLDKNAVKPMDTLKCSRLILETLTAFDKCIMSKRSIPELHDIDELLDKENEVLDMLLNGIKA
jgi:TetR/AcrR family transcriptional regulator